MSETYTKTGAEHIASAVQNGSVIYDGPIDRWNGTDNENGGIIVHGHDGSIVSVEVQERNQERDINVLYTFGEGGRVETVTSIASGESGDNILSRIQYEYDGNGALVASERTEQNSEGISEHHLVLYCDDGNGCLDNLGNAQHSVSAVDINLDTGRIVSLDSVSPDHRIEAVEKEVLSKNDIEALAEKGEVVLPDDWDNIVKDLPDYDGDVNPDTELTPDSVEMEDDFDDGPSDK